MTITELNNKIIASLSPSLGGGEARATARLLLEDDLGVTPAKLLLNPNRQLEPETIARFTRYINDIVAGMPPQYAVGKAHFMGMTLEVTPATLIPRPETATLVDIVTDTLGHRADLTGCDIGTGSGCIAIALARALPFAGIAAFDISAEALQVARRNAAALKADIEFIQADALKGLPYPSTPYDFIVSNPPYIAESEKAGMESRVKDHEPSSALFVPDDDPLRFYKAIILYAADALKHNGYVFFEINPLFATQLCEMCRNHGFDCDIRRDMYGRERFAICSHLS